MSILTIFSPVDRASNLIRINHGGLPERLYSHELEQFHIIGGFPPLLPFVRVVGRDRWVSNRCIKLYQGGQSAWLYPGYQGESLLTQTSNNHASKTDIFRLAFSSTSCQLHLETTNVHMTFPFIAASSSSSPTEGTGTPHVKSRVTAVGRNPPFILGSTISPLARMTALLAHLPFSRVSCRKVSNRDCRASSRRQEWVEGFVESLWLLFRLHRGCKSSVGEEKVPAH
jgi:hypothetical protein